MSRLIETQSHSTDQAARHVFELVLAEHSADASVDTAQLLERVGEVGRALAEHAAHGAVVASALDWLEVKPLVGGGERLVVTAALEASSPDRFPVSLVARRSDGPSAQVVVSGLLVFRPAERAPQASAVFAPAAVGSSLVKSAFFARRSGVDWLTSGNLVRWLHEAALVSAQGHAGAPATLERIEGLSLVGPLAGDEAVVLECSVVKVKAGLLTVLSRLVRERDGHGVLCALTQWRVRAR
jgi:hypothetical protein